MHCALRNSLHIWKSRDFACASYSIYFHPWFLSFQLLSRFSIKVILLFNHRLWQAFMWFGVFSFVINVSKQNKRSQSILDEGGPLKKKLSLTAEGSTLDRVLSFFSRCTFCIIIIKHFLFLMVKHEFRLCLYTFSSKRAFYFKDVFVSFSE